MLSFFHKPIESSRRKKETPTALSERLTFVQVANPTEDDDTRFYIVTDKDSGTQFIYVRRMSDFVISPINQQK